MSNHYSVETFLEQPTLGHLVRRSSALLTQLAANAFDERGVPFTQWLALLKLRGESPQSIGQLAAAIGHDQGAMTRVIDALAQQHFVTRLRSARDRRRVEINLTPAGREYVDAQLPFVVDGTNTLLECFTRQEYDTLIHLLQRLLTRLEAYDIEEARHIAAEFGKTP